MKSGHLEAYCKCYNRKKAPLTSLLYFFALLPGPASTQDIASTIDITSTFTGRPTRSASIPYATTSHFSPTTSFRTSSGTNTTSSTSSSTTKANGLPPALGISPANETQDPSTERTSSVFNYYFLFLAVFGVLVALCLWWCHRRRKRRKELMRLSGQNALARDLDGWVNTRRWMHGRWRHNQTAAFIRREEGLNEHGEAPPPYQPKSETTVSQQDATPARDATNNISIPLRALPRDEIERVQPPEYSEHRRNLSHDRPDTAITQMSRPATSISHPNASTRDLLRGGQSQFSS